MKQTLLLLATLASTTLAQAPLAEASEWDSHTIGTKDYLVNGSYYYRDYCQAFYSGRSKATGLSGYQWRHDGILHSVAAWCHNGGTTPERGEYRDPNAGLDYRSAWCPGGWYMNALRGYADGAGPTSVSVGCVNGSGAPTASPAGPIGTYRGPYYNSVRCPTGQVAWGVWGSEGTVLGRLGMICNNQ